MQREVSEAVSTGLSRPPFSSQADGCRLGDLERKLAVGYLLDELKNDITREPPASFEPSIDYVQQAARNDTLSLAA